VREKAKVLKKIFISNKFRGSIELPDTKDAIHILNRIKKVYPTRESITLDLLFSKKKLHQLKSYQKGGAHEELLNIDFYIELGKLLNFTTTDAKELKASIELINDRAHYYFNISKRLKLFNKEKRAKTKKRYLFWDIENFSSIGSIFSDIVEPYNIEDEYIYLAANPDSLYLKRAEWEANLRDYGKTLTSFHFTKCDHGKNVADDVLLNDFKNLHLRGADVYVLTFDAELKERFQEVCHKSNNLYMMSNNV